MNTRVICTVCLGAYIHDCLWELLKCDWTILVYIEMVKDIFDIYWLDSWCDNLDELCEFLETESSSLIHIEIFKDIFDIKLIVLDDFFEFVDQHLCLWITVREIIFVIKLLEFLDVDLSVLVDIEFIKYILTLQESDGRIQLTQEIVKFVSIEETTLVLVKLFKEITKLPVILLHHDLHILEGLFSFFMEKFVLLEFDLRWLHRLRF